MSFTKKNRITPSLLLAFSKGDESAFETIYWHYNLRLYNFVYSLLGDKMAAQDITQNVFVKIWEKRVSVDPEQNFESYLFTVTRHLVYKELEERLNVSIRLKQMEIDMQEPVDCSTEHSLEAHFTQEYISSLIDKLPKARKQIFKMSRFEHLSNKEIAERLSISERTVETQLYRTILYLKKHLSPAEGLGLLFLLLRSF